MTRDASYGHVQQGKTAASAPVSASLSHFDSHHYYYWFGVGCDRGNEIRDFLG